MILGHTIALDPTFAQEANFRRACGVARFAYNWALAELKRRYEAKEKPSASKIKAAWNEHRKSLPWTFEVSKCVSGQSVMDLGTAFTNFFRDVKKPKRQRRFRYPRFKSKRHDNGFALWNDQFQIEGNRIRVPRLGWVRMHEPLRFSGKIMGARIARVGTRWCVSVQVDTAVVKDCSTIEVVGIDVGISHLMALSKPLPDGTVKIKNPQARRSLMKRQRKLARRISRQELQRRKTAAKTSRRQMRRRDALRRLHYRIASIRKDAIHKATTLVAANFQTIVLENLNVLGMTKNHRLAGSILDASFGEIRRQLEYKSSMRGGRVVLADRYFPSSKTCSDCGQVVDSLPLSVRSWSCANCGTIHDRDLNAAKNLELLVVGAACSESSAGDRSDTRGEIGALAVGQPATKLWSVNRELEPSSLPKLA